MFKSNLWKRLLIAGIQRVCDCIVDGIITTDEGIPGVKYIESGSKTLEPVSCVLDIKLYTGEEIMNAGVPAYEINKREGLNIPQVPVGERLVSERRERRFIFKDIDKRKLVTVGAAWVILIGVRCSERIRKTISKQGVRFKRE